MTKYAQNTTVSVEKTRMDIERTLERYGAKQFGYVRDDDRGLAAITFAANNRQIKFVLQLPPRNDREFHFSRRGQRTPQKALEAWEGACRQRWRALLLCIKGKLEAVESEISTFEDEFLSHIVLPDGGTVGEMLKPQIENAYETGKMPSGIAGLLPAPEED